MEISSKGFSFSHSREKPAGMKNDEIINRWAEESDEKKVSAGPQRRMIIG